MQNITIFMQSHDLMNEWQVNGLVDIRNNVIIADITAGQRN